ncbi:dGTP triphosphohydrolase [Pareuzebyella sediminis]|uniref:dGTP triphosphohydrolase n=1 Tax=Pareuzebyella sediminis TaxID=2607998 RepID=UPI0011F05721|nr:dNTP triphosphohydrolase [Pareuzebyella sediminis]
MKKWEQLLQPLTFRNRTKAREIDGRDPFEQDYGRLISSSPIRRLQDKTQVFPLETSDYIRTRLTHSLEVSYIGGSIGKSIEKYLIEKKELNQDFKGQLSSLLRCSGLVHDLGNPPFGHFGESAIKDYFKEYFEKSEVKLTKQEKADFENFDGNVQTFRILRKLHFFKDEYSFNLTFPTLASIIKYPSNSLEGNKKKEAKEIRNKKYGYYCSEESDYQEISKKLGLNGKRHPIVYLMEAADDIAYCAADIEDGVKLGILNYETLRRIFDENLKANRDLLEILDKMHKGNDNKLSDKLSLTVQQFRVETQGRMIEGIVDCFKKNYVKIMDGGFQYELIDKSTGNDIRKSFEALQTVVFDNKKIMQTELAGWEIIYGLLDIFVPATESENFKAGGNTKEARLFKNISSSYRYIYSEYNKYDNEAYNRIQLIVDFIAGMTDTYALNLYRKLKGIRL